ETETSQLFKMNDVCFKGIKKPSCVQEGKTHYTNDLISYTCPLFNGWLKIRSSMIPATKSGDLNIPFSLNSMNCSTSVKSSFFVFLIISCISVSITPGENEIIMTGCSAVSCSKATDFVNISRPALDDEEPVHPCLARLAAPDEIFTITFFDANEAV